MLTAPIQRSRTWSLAFVYVWARARLCVPFFSLWHRGYTGLWRHCSAPLSWTKPCVCWRGGLASPSNICSCCRTPTVVTHSETLHWPAHGWQQIWVAVPRRTHCVSWVCGVSGQFEEWVQGIEPFVPLCFILGNAFSFAWTVGLFVWLLIGRTRTAQWTVLGECSFSPFSLPLQFGFISSRGSFLETYSSAFISQTSNSD